MTVSVRAYLIAGAAAATATTIALTPVQVTPADIAVPAHPTSTGPALSQAMVELLAAASRMTAAVPAPPTPAPIPGAGPSTGAAPSLTTPNALVITPQNAASDWVTSAYQFIQYWVNYGVDVAQWALGWVPYGYLIGDQIGIVYDNLVVPIANTVVYNLINPVLNAPLNLGVWANGIADVAWSVVAGAINTGIAEANYFLGWVLPPLPPLPLPPLPFATTVQTTALSSVTPTPTLSTALAGVSESLAGAFKGLTDQLTTAGGTDADADAGAAKSPVQNVVADVEAATSSVADQLQNAAEKAEEQVPGTTTTTQTDEVTTVPKSVQQSLQSQKPSPRSRIKDVRDGVRNATADLKSNLQKATDGLRNAVKDATKSKPATVNKTDAPAKDTSDKSGDE
jgi:hypothetical protein